MSPPVAAVAPVTPGLYQTLYIKYKTQTHITDKDEFPWLYPVYLLCFSSRRPASCFGPAAAGNCEPAGRHHGNSPVWILACLSVSLLLLSFDFVHHFLISQAQQMTMQAMAIVISPVSSPTTSPITSPPMSPVPHHQPSSYAVTSPYAVIPPSPYANIPPSPYANFSPSPYAAAVFQPSAYPADPLTEPQAQQEPQPAYCDPHLSSSKAKPAQPTFKPATQVRH